LSRQWKDEEYTVTVDLELPKDRVHPDEIRLVAASLGGLLKRVIRDTETMKG